MNKLRKRLPEQRLLTYVEPVPIEEKFANGFAAIKLSSDRRRILLVSYVDHVEPPELGGGDARRINGRMIMTIEAAAELHHMLGDLLAVAEPPIAPIPTKEPAAA